ncbi:MAG: acyl carrier protein [Candidatus Symbiothrix sp.]|jgi:acyl carrier protein|nr:acyl carrier protein [Candidatus Symbiothrix sp.]
MKCLNFDDLIHLLDTLGLLENKEKLDIMDPLTNFSIDSLSAAELILCIEKELGVYVPISIFYKSITLFDIINNVNSIIKSK